MTDMAIFYDGGWDRVGIPSDWTFFSLSANFIDNKRKRPRTARAIRGRSRLRCQLIGPIRLIVAKITEILYSRSSERGWPPRNHFRNQPISTAQ